MARRKSQKRTPSMIRRDRKNASKYYLMGWDMQKIAEELGISIATVSRDLKAVRRQWEKESIDDIHAMKMQELKKIDQLEITYWEAWLNSCEDAETIRQEGEASAANNRPQPKKIVRSVKGQTGDPRYLAGVQWCINKRCDILGINAPTEIKQTTTIDVSKMSTEELERIVKGK